MHRKHKNAIVLAMFGTAVEPALSSLLNIHKRMIAAFPGTPVEMAFTSTIIRKKWRERAADPMYLKTHPEIPTAVFHVKTVLATIADLQDQGYDTIILQPTYVAMGEEYLDLATYVDGLMYMGTIKKAKYKPFYKIALGRPALGAHDTHHPYALDIIAAAKALGEDTHSAEKQQAALVYMGHGNRHFPSAGPYLELANQMCQMYPDVLTLIGNVEGFPALQEVMDSLRMHRVKKVLLKPCMVTAGGHAINDMAGSASNSWQNILEENGFQVSVVHRGLGDIDAFADIFIQHAAEAAHDAGIILE